MKSAIKFLKRCKTLIITAVTIICLGAGSLAVAQYINSCAEERCIDTMKREAHQVGTALKTHMSNDTENLTIAAEMLASLEHPETADVVRTLGNFKSCEYMEDIQLLLSDNTVISGSGEIGKVSSDLFSELSSKGAYISEMTSDILTHSRKVVYNAVPVVKNGDVIGILAGMTPIGALKSIVSEAASGDAHIFIIESNSGDFLVDTMHSTLENASEFGQDGECGGESAADAAKDIANGESGSTTFFSEQENEKRYLYYEPVGINSWVMMYSMPESTVTSDVRSQKYALSVFMVYMAVLLIGYFLYMLISGVNNRRYNAFVVELEKILLSDCRSKDNIVRAMKLAAGRENAEAVYYIEAGDQDEAGVYEWTTEGEFIPDNRALLRELVSFCSKNADPEGHGGFEYTAGMEAEYPAAAEFAKSKAGSTILYYVIDDDEGAVTGVLGMAGKRLKGKAESIIENTAISVSMAVKNLRYINLIEKIGMTDALTGLKNRACFHKDMDETPAAGFTCIYADANGLHELNSTSGHANGDEMLRFIANTVKDEFGENYAYRIGGDEFLAFAQNVSYHEAAQRAERMCARIESGGYTASIGICVGTEDSSIHDIVSAAERMMYKEKYNYYLDKEEGQAAEIDSRKAGADNASSELKVSGKYFDVFLKLIEPKYLGVYMVDLKTDTMRKIYTPEYFENMLHDANNCFSAAMKLYMKDIVKHDYVRGFSMFFDYEWLEEQLADGKEPSLTYERTDGVEVKMTVCRLDESNYTVWIFEKA